MAVQEFGRRNPLLAKQLSDAISKLSEMHHHTTRLADCRNNWLKKVWPPSRRKHLEITRRRCTKVTQTFAVLVLQAVCYLDEYNEMLDFIVRWSEKAKSLVRANIIWNSTVHLQEQIRMYQVRICFHVPECLKWSLNYANKTSDEQRHMWDYCVKKNKNQNANAS